MVTEYCEEVGPDVGAASRGISWKGDSLLGPYAWWDLTSL
jgi:hypothetical protein